MDPNAVPNGFEVVVDPNNANVNPNNNPPNPWELLANMEAMQAQINQMNANQLATNQLLAQLNAQFNQQGQQQPAPAPAPVGVPQPEAVQERELKPQDPPAFSGDRNEAETFIRTLRGVFMLSPSRFPNGDQQRRILYALQLIRGGTAGTWANNHAAVMMNPNVANPFDTFDAFARAFDRAFGSADRAQKARNDMANLKMKNNDTAEDYTTAFEALAIHTQYDEIAHIQAYRTGLHPKIVEKIYSDSNGELPAGLEAWKVKARRIDHLHRELRAIQNHPAVGNHQRNRNAAMANARVTTVPVNTAAVNPVPAADAMDVDGHRRTVRCYNCNKFGHISRNCPEPKRSRSFIRANELADTIRAVLAESNAEPTTEPSQPSNEESGFQSSQQ